MSEQHDIVLALMPWAPVSAPSIQLGLLRALVEAEGLTAAALHLNVDLVARLEATPGGVEGTTAHRAYEVVKRAPTLRSWLFAVPPIVDVQGEAKRRLDRLLARAATPGEREQSSAVRALRGLIPAFLEQCAEEILAHHPKVVGFSCTTGDRTASLVMARILKERRPEVRVVLGGTHVWGEMGAALMRAFDWIDVVVRGEAEEVIGPLFHDLCSGGPVRSRPGLVVRIDDHLEIHPTELAPAAELSRSPLPSYAEYFQRVAGSSLAGRIGPSLTLETSRGCWRARSRCRFCGRAEAHLVHRRKEAVQVVGEMRALSRRHGVTAFVAADASADPERIAEVADTLYAAGDPFTTWCQTRANIERDKLERMARGGFRSLFLGIESLSTPVLQLMNKGHTALQAIRTLKWTQELGIDVQWSLMHGIPGEAPEHYRNIADVTDAIGHLQPPAAFSPLMLMRHSHFCEHATDHGIEIRIDSAPATADEGTGGTPHRSEQDPLVSVARANGAEHDAEALTASVEGSYPTIPDSTLSLCRYAVEAWQRNYARNKGRLWCRLKGEVLKVVDQRLRRPAAYALDGWRGRSYLGCDAGATVESVWRDLHEEARQSTTEDEVRAFLDEMVAMHLVYEEAGTYLALAIRHDHTT